MHSIILKLKNNTCNYIEYDKNKHKSFNDIYYDVVSMYELFKKQGIEQGDRVGLLCKNCYEYLVVDLACILGGYIMVAFHQNDNFMKSEKLFTQYNLKLLIVDEVYENSIEQKNKILYLDQVKDWLNTNTVNIQSNSIESSPFMAEDLFTIVFTSGSTGRSKGLAVKYKCPEEFVHTCIDKFKLCDTDKVLLFLPMSQFSSRCYVYAAILIGFNLAVVKPDELLWGLRKYKPTTFQAVPFVFEQIGETLKNKINNSMKLHVLYKLFLMIKKILPTNIKRKIQKKLFRNIYELFGGNIRLMITGAAPVSPYLLETFCDIGLTIYEGYGLVESGMIALNYPGNNRIGSVGKILENKRVKLDQDGQILVSSQYLWGDSYIDANEEDNKRVFLSDGWIATGDIGYFDEDEFLYITGRMKDVIIMSTGLKINPLTIEKELYALDLIRQAIVFGDNMPGLVAVIVPKDNSVTNELLQNEVRKVNASLPKDYRVNDFIISDIAFTVENGMMTSNIKMNRKEIFNRFKNQINACGNLS